MSTSPRRAPQEDSGKPRSSPEPQPFPYNSILADRTRSVFAHIAGASTVQPTTESHATADTREAQARARGWREGQSEAQKAFEEQLTKERSNLAHAVAEFAGQRAGYFQKVEAEVVQLALSIARKIMHREAQVDPLLLAGIARVALERIDGSTHVVLHVHPQTAADWRTYLNTQLDAAIRPEILEDSSQPIGSCTLETAMGSAVIGLEVQLKEIENGFLDLLALRPGVGS